MFKFTTQAEKSADQVADEIRSMSRAAASLAMRGESYGPEDRADCAAAILSAHITGKFRAPRCGDCGGPAIRAVPIMDDYGTAVRVPRCLKHGRCEGARILRGASVEMPTFTALYRDAMNYRQSADRRRARDAADAAAKAAAEGFTPKVRSESDEVRATPWGARRTALEMLRAMGEDVTATIGGPLWTAAYAAARASAGLESDAIAAELELTPSAYRKHLSRAAAAVGQGLAPRAVEMLTAGKLAPEDAPMSDRYRVGRTDHRAYMADVLSIPEPHSMKASYSRTHSADLEADWRTRPDAAAPVSCTVDPPRCALAAAQGDRTWAEVLPAATAARLARAADLRRARAAAKDEAQRTADRLSAGLPATVR